MKTNTFIFDTNSLISALLIPSSVSRKALNKAIVKGSLIFSEETFAELSEVLIRSKFDKYVLLHERLEFIDRLRTIGKFVTTTSNFTNCRDVRDNKFLNLAFDSKTEYIVTGDNDLLVLSPFEQIQIITPAVFLADLVI